MLSSASSTYQQQTRRHYRLQLCSCGDLVASLCKMFRCRAKTLRKAHLQTELRRDVIEIGGQDLMGYCLSCGGEQKLGMVFFDILDTAGLVGGEGIENQG